MKSVYVMKSGSAYKIGVSENPERRLRGLQIGNCDIKLVYKSELLKNAYTIESALHKKYCDCALGREWFSVEDEKRLVEDVCKLIDEIGNYEIESDLSKQQTGCSMDDLLLWMLAPQKRKLDELIKDVEEINKGNKILADILIKQGWTKAEVDALIEEAIKTA